jgi:hypothetical protein
MALFCALWLATPALGAGFEGLRPDPDAPLAVGGRIDARDEDDRTFRIGGMLFEVPPGLVDFEQLEPGRFVEVTYEDRADGLVATRIVFRKMAEH